MPLISLAYRNIRTTNDVEDIIEQEFNNSFDQWRKLTDEIFSELIEQHEIGVAALQKKATPSLLKSIPSDEYSFPKKSPRRGPKPPFHREVQHLQVVGISNYSPLHAA